MLLCVVAVVCCAALEPAQRCRRTKTIGRNYMLGAMDTRRQEEHRCILARSGSEARAGMHGEQGRAAEVEAVIAPALRCSVRSLGLLTPLTDRVGHKVRLGGRHTLM